MVHHFSRISDLGFMENQVQKFLNGYQNENFKDKTVKIFLKVEGLARLNVQVIIFRSNYIKPYMYIHTGIFLSSCITMHVLTPGIRLCVQKL